LLGDIVRSGFKVLAIQEEDMPTMVERVTQFLEQALRFDAIDGPGAQAAFTTLDGEIDTSLSALQQAATGTTTAFRAAERADGGVFQALGDGASGLGFDFQRDAIVLDVGDLVLGGPQSIETATQAAFVALDKQFFGTGLDLEGFGADLAGLGRARTPADFTALEKSLVGDATTLSTDFATLASDAGTLISSLPGSSTPPTTIQNALATTGGTPNPFAAPLTAIEGEFSELSGDFSSLAGLFGGGGGSGGPTIESAVKPASATSSGGTVTAPGPFDTVFAALDTHFLALDGSLQGLAGPLANLLLPAVQQT
jgi:hypothetical protein